MASIYQSTQKENDNREHAPKLLTNIKVPKEIANLAKVYCIFNKKTLTEFITRLLEKELEEFREELKGLRRIKRGIS